jgi:hypothetical protein
VAVGHFLYVHVVISSVALPSCTATVAAAKGASSALLHRGDLLEGEGCLYVLAGFVDVEAVEVVFVAGDLVEGVYLFCYFSICAAGHSYVSAA